MARFFAGEGDRGRPVTRGRTGLLGDLLDGEGPVVPAVFQAQLRTETDGAAFLEGHAACSLEGAPEGRFPGKGRVLARGPRPQAAQKAPQGIVALIRRANVEGGFVEHGFVQIVHEDLFSVQR